MSWKWQESLAFLFYYFFFGMSARLIVLADITVPAKAIIEQLTFHGHVTPPPPPFRKLSRIDFSILLVLFFFLPFPFSFFIPQSRID